jgi:hypothetical protein
MAKGKRGMKIKGVSEHEGKHRKGKKGKKKGGKKGKK